MQSIPPGKLPVLKIVGESLVLPLRSASVIFGYAWPLLLVLAAVDGMMSWAMFPLELRLRENPKDLAPSYFALSLIALLTTAAIGAALAVPWHRYLIEDRKPSYSVLVHERGRIVRYVLWGLAAVLVYILAAIPASLLTALGLFSTDKLLTGEPSGASQLAMVATFLVCLAPFYRYCLIFPSAAVADGAGLRAIAFATKGNALRLALGSLLAELPSLVLGWLVRLVLDPSQAQTWGAHIAGTLALDVIYMLAGMTAVTFLSLSYRHFAPALRDAVLHEEEIATGTYRGQE